MYSIENMMKLDENIERQRQRQLYKTDLKYDPNRPIFQHSINVANFTNSNEQVFSQMARNLGHLTPQNQSSQQFKNYIQKLEQIQNLQQGHINQLQQQQVDKTIKDLILQIQSNNKLIEQTTLQNNNQIQSFLVYKKQAQQYLKSVQENTIFLKTLSKNQELLKNKTQEFLKQKNNLQQERAQVYHDFDRQYKTVEFEKVTLTKMQNEQKGKRKYASQLQKQISLIHKAGFQLQDQVDHIKLQLNKQNILKTQNDKKQVKIDLSSNQINISAEEESKEKPNLKNQQKASINSNTNENKENRKVNPLVSIVKQDPNWWLPLLLGLATVYLGYVTVLRLL